MLLRLLEEIGGVAQGDGAVAAHHAHTAGRPRQRVRGVADILAGKPRAIGQPADAADADIAAVFLAPGNAGQTLLRSC